MSGWETLNCANHPERIALERCEVCDKPLCAYCLYYTEDGQRLCEEHAEQARLMGAHIEEPALYADQLVGAQIGAVRKRKRKEVADDDGLYHGNSQDLMSLIGLMIGVISLGACCGAGYCLPLVGFALSLVAVFNAKKAHDPRRTRRMGIIGLLVSSVWVAVIVMCIALYGLSISSVFTTIRNPSWYIPTSVYSTNTPAPRPATHTPDPNPATHTPDSAPSNTPTPAEGLSNAGFVLPDATPVPDVVDARGELVLDADEHR